MIKTHYSPTIFAGSGNRQSLLAFVTLSSPYSIKWLTLASLFFLVLAFSLPLQAEEGYGCEFVPNYPPATHFPDGYSDCETYFLS